MFLKQAVMDFLRFVAAPKTFHARKLAVPQKISASFILLVLKFGFSLLIAGLVGLFYEPKNLTDQSLSERFTPFMYLIIGGMLLPLFEEVLFRLSLKFKPVYLMITSICAGYYLSTKFLFDTRISAFDETFYHRVGIAICFGLLCNPPQNSDCE